MAVATGSTDPTVIYEALVVDRYTDAAWSEYLRARSRADDGRDPVGATVAPDGGQLEAPALVDLHVGDHVQDRDDSDATMIVVGLPPETAAEYDVDGTPLTEFNSEYPEDDSVVEVVYPQRTDVDVTENRYAFPRSRLRLEAPLHDRDDETEGDR